MRLRYRSLITLPHLKYAYSVPIKSKPIKELHNAHFKKVLRTNY
nr:MAG TPA: hypothetical protein [Caudoviricetes sp.]